MLLTNLMSLVENGVSMPNKLVSDGICRSESGENNCTAELQLDGTVQYNTPANYTIIIIIYGRLQKFVNQKHFLLACDHYQGCVDVCVCVSN